MRRRQVWLILLAVWFGVLAVIAGSWAVVQFWVLDGGPATTSSHAYGTVMASSTAFEITPALEETQADLLLPAPSPVGSEADGKPPLPTLAPPEATAEPTETAQPTDTPHPTETPSPTASPIPSGTLSPAATETPAPKAQKAGKPTKTPKPESFRLYYKRMPDGSLQVFHQGSYTQELMPVFEPGKGRVAYSAAWAPGGEQVLIAASWMTSKSDFGERLRLFNRDGSGGHDIFMVDSFNVGGAEKARDMGNALWSPDGQTIAMWYVEGPNDGVFVLNSDGTGLRRMDNSQAGDWPRWWSTDGEWIVVINENGGLFALDVAETVRIPWDSLEGVRLYDQRTFPWRETQKPTCGKQGITTNRSWWSCK